MDDSDRRKNNKGSYRGLGIGLPQTPGNSDLDFLLPRFHKVSRSPSSNSSVYSSPVSPATRTSTPTGTRTPDEFDCFYTPKLPWTSPKLSGGQPNAHATSTAPSPETRSTSMKKRRVSTPPSSETSSVLMSAWESPKSSPKSVRFPSGRHGKKTTRTSFLYVFAFLAFILLLGAATTATSSELFRSIRMFKKDDTHTHAYQPSSLETFQHDQPERDTIVMYRIIGNDLPPRHALNQTLQNLHFLLSNEHNISNTVQLFGPSPSDNRPALHIDKYFVLNRITSADTRTAIRRLLLEKGISDDRILEIPFEWEEYEQRQLRWDGGVADAADVWGLGRHKDQSGEQRLNEAIISNQTILAVADEASPVQNGKRRKKLETIGKLRALDYTYHDKNLYAMNNNGGRNFVLEHGRSLPHARWILPLDGNCFFTPPALAALIDTLRTAGEGPFPKQHVIIPMKRLLDNEAIRATNSIEALAGEGTQQPVAPDEPQVGFRYDSSEFFQEQMRYGRRSKLEFLWRLGAIPRSRKLHKRTLPWESSDRSFLTSSTYASIVSRRDPEDLTDFAPAGWVYRLFSGDRNQEVTSPTANSLRNMNRIKGIVSYLEGLDEQLARGKLCSEDRRACGFDQRNTVVWSLPALRELRDAIRAEQPEALERLILLSRQLTPAKGAIQEISESLADSALVAYLKDDLRLARQAAETISAQLFTNLRQFLYESEEALEHGLSNVTEIADGEGYAFPILPPSRQSGIRAPAWQILSYPRSRLSSVRLPFSPAEFDPSLLLDGVRLIHEMDAGLLPIPSLQILFSAHLAHLLDTDQVKQSANFTLEEARNYDLKIVALAAFLDDVVLLNRVKHRAHLRSRQHRVDPVLSTRLAHAGLIETVDQDNLAAWQVSNQIRIS